MIYLYIAVDGDVCKIGYSNNPHRRCREIYYDSYSQDGIRDAPIVAAWPVGEAAAKVESLVIAALKPYAMPYGGEWFTVSRQTMVLTIRRVLREMGISSRAIHRRRAKSGKLAGWPCRYTMKEFG